MQLEHQCIFQRIHQLTITRWASQNKYKTYIVEELNIVHVCYNLYGERKGESVLNDFYVDLHLNVLKMYNLLFVSFRMEAHPAVQN